MMKKKGEENMRENNFCVIWLGEKMRGKFGRVQVFSLQTHQNTISQIGEKSGEKINWHFDKKYLCNNILLSSFGFFFFSFSFYFSCVLVFLFLFFFSSFSFFFHFCHFMLLLLQFFFFF